MTATIRPAVPGDETAWRRLWANYLAFYATDLAPEITEATWARILDPAAPMGLLVAEEAGAVRGFALHLSHASSWSPGDDLYLEDLFVATDARGRGLGRALIEALIALGRAQGRGRLYWMADEGNARARALYDSFAPSDGHVRYRVRLSEGGAEAAVARP